MSHTSFVYSKDSSVRLIKTAKNCIGNVIPSHYATTGHQFLFQDSRILTRESNGFKMKIIEGKHVYNKKDKCVNIIAGPKIDNSWNSILKDLSL